MKFTHPSLSTSPPPSRSSVTEQVRVAELELSAQALKDTLKEKEREIEGTVREMRKQQADRHRWLQQYYFFCSIFPTIYFVSTTASTAWTSTD